MQEGYCKFLDALQKTEALLLTASPFQGDSELNVENLGSVLAISALS